MFPSPDDTIVAIASPSGGAGRGIVRVSGPQTLACIEPCFRVETGIGDLASLRSARTTSGTLVVADPPLELDCQLLLWPTVRSYTRQPTAEIHTIGSPPLLHAIVQALCSHGARIAEPGEFTLRAFLAGRLDLTQAEAVLGVIDARGEGELRVALTQLAGGMSEPLNALRNSLLDLLADFEAGLDFVEDDIEFVASAQVMAQLTGARELVQRTRVQLDQRAMPQVLPQVVLVGAPNAGKSSLFNAMVKEFANGRESVPALVSHVSGTTRDFLTAKIQIDGMWCELVDTAGVAPASLEESIDSAAQEMTSTTSDRATLRLLCVDATTVDGADEIDFAYDAVAVTKVDLVGERTQRPIEFQAPTVYCSSVTGIGLTELASSIATLLGSESYSEAAAIGSTAERCSESLVRADEHLGAALELAEEAGPEELIAVEIRAALEQLGRVTGAVSTDDVLDRIFSKFCIGK